MDCYTKAKFVCERQEGFDHITEGIDGEVLPELKDA
jgi:hypothetical protein